MWLFTKDGFYSVVHDDYCNKGELMIRARVIDDLERLLGKLELSDADILIINNADYRYRLKLTNEQWAAYVAAEVAGIDYDNFKNTLPAREQRRAAAYMKCWEAMYLLQEDMTPFNHWGDE